MKGFTTRDENRRFQRWYKKLSDDSPGSRAWGFWNDTGVSSYTTIRFHSLERALLTDSSIEWHSKQLVRYCFYPRERFIVEPANSIMLFMCK